MSDVRKEALKKALMQFARGTRRGGKIAPKAPPEPTEAQPGGDEFVARLMTPPELRGAPGMTAHGNIDLYHRPAVRNEDGSISSVRSMSFNDGTGEILVPTVVGDRVVSERDAIAEYRRTGNHLGRFATPDDATEYADRLHEQQANLTRRR